jgi:hypothetical protein
MIISRPILNFQSPGESCMDPEMGGAAVIMEFSSVFYFSRRFTGIQPATAKIHAVFG